MKPQFRELSVLEKDVYYEENKIALEKAIDLDALNNQVYTYIDDTFNTFKLIAFKHFIETIVEATYEKLTVYEVFPFITDKLYHHLITNGMERLRIKTIESIE